MDERFHVYVLLFCQVAQVHIWTWMRVYVPVNMTCTVLRLDFWKKVLLTSFVSSLITLWGSSFPSCCWPNSPILYVWHFLNIISPSVWIHDTGDEDMELFSISTLFFFFFSQKHYLNKHIGLSTSHKGTTGTKNSFFSVQNCAFVLLPC